MLMKEQVAKLLEDHIDSVVSKLTECTELIYEAGYNQAIDKVLIVIEKHQDRMLTIEEIEDLRK